MAGVIKFLPDAVCAGRSAGDGLPDSWEQQYFGGSTNANPSAVASNGVNTIREVYIAGLNPNDPASRLELSSIYPLRWNAASGRVYSVYWSSNLLSGFEPLATNIPWNGSVFTDSLHSAENQGFYRIKVRLEP